MTFEPACKNNNEIAMNGIKYHDTCEPYNSASIVPSRQGISEAGNENALTAWKYTAPFDAGFSVLDDEAF
jgi:hypothetical protein